jgi:hypothetical protein
MSRTKFKVSWEAQDGYVGGSRPQSFSVDIDEFDSSQTLDDITRQLTDDIDNDFEEKVYWHSDNYEQVAQEIFDALQSEEVAG